MPHPGMPNYPMSMNPGMQMSQEGMRMPQDGMRMPQDGMQMPNMPPQMGPRGMPGYPGMMPGQYGMQPGMGMPPSSHHQRMPQPPNSQMQPTGGHGTPTTSSMSHSIASLVSSPSGVTNTSQAMPPTTTTSSMETPQTDKTTTQPQTSETSQAERESSMVTPKPEEGAYVSEASLNNEKKRSESNHTRKVRLYQF